MMSVSKSLRAVFILLLCVVINAQNYGDFARGAGVPRRRNNNRMPVAAMVASGVVGGALGYWVTARRMKKLCAQEKAELVNFIEQQSDYQQQREKRFQQDYQKLYKQYEALQKESVERDYEEFKAPDTDNDDMISRKEFNSYVQKYLQSFPELSDKDFPKFDEFDLDGDGLVSFDEWQEFLYQQKLNEAKKKSQGDKKHVADALEKLYEQTASSNNFNALQKKMNSNQPRRE